MKYSSLAKIKRVTAYCIRFINNAKVHREKRTIGPLNTGELQHAMLVCVKSAQREEFGQTIEEIQAGKCGSTRLLSLNPFLDRGGLLRVGGRIRHANCSYDQRFPILLPKKHWLTELIVKEIHVNQLHSGPQATLAAIQQKFWIINGRSVVRQYIHRCHKCVRDRAVTLEQQMGDLPAHRLEPVRPFLRCGVDYGGPFYIKTLKGRGGKTIKGYIALFVCFATKAVHIEVVSDLTTSTFIAALKRFIARRGKPTDIYSDNATNFVGAKNELLELQQQFKSEHHNTTIANFLSGEGINWHFIPANAPHFGGLWEAGIKSAKNHLRKVMGDTKLTFEEFNTVVSQVEMCLNSRPLCPLSSDPNDLAALTPGHFLIGAPLNDCPEPSLCDIKINKLSRWQLTQQMYQHFWKRWKQEYLSQLQQRAKWIFKRDNIKVGDMVLLKENNVPPLRWIKGRVQCTHPGKDEVIRVVTIKTINGTFKRPIVKLCLLPM